jgi:hypothetical protein
MTSRIFTGRRGPAAFTAVATLLGAVVLSAGLPGAAVAAPVAAAPTAASCSMGNGLRHVISIVFDTVHVHFSRDNSLRS